MENWDNNKILKNKTLKNKNKRKNNKKENSNYSEESVMGHLPEDNSKFIKPTVLEIDNYIKKLTKQIYEYNKDKPQDQRKQLPIFSAEQFFDYYESNGWLVGKHHMKNWKATVRNWTRNDFRKKDNQKETKLPDWFDKDLQNEEMSKEDADEFDKLVFDITESVKNINDN